MENKRIEIARSYSRKINTGNFENIDVFCSAKQEVDEKDFEETSLKLCNLCEKEVEEKVKQIKVMNGYPKRQVVTDKTGDLKWVAVEKEQIKEMLKK